MGVPGNANALLLRSASAAASGGVSRSLRFNGSVDSSYLSKTFSTSATSTQKLTYSTWLKRTTLDNSGIEHFGLSAAVSGSSRDAIRFNSNNIEVFFNEATSGAVYTNAVFRDASAWYHIVVSIDTTNATTADRIIIYVNGVRQTVSGTQPSQNYNFTGFLVSGKEQNIGRSPQPAYYSNSYLADVYCLDGLALDPTSFGETDATTGVWNPKAYTGSYGTNGFHLEFADNSAATATTLGKDTSGNGNNWTPNNLSVTAGAGNDSLVDVPTNGSQTDTGVGGEVRGNYCTWNPLANVGNTLSNGNLDGTTTSAGICKGTIAVSSGKWYWEVTVTSSSGGYNSIGFSEVSVAPSTSYLGIGSTWSYYQFNGQIYTNGGATSYGASYTTGDVIGIALDLDNDQVTFYKNGTSQGVAATGLTGTYTPAFGNDQNGPSIAANFGQRAFAYTAPSGFKALCTANLPTPSVTKPSSVMDVLLWSGNSTNGRNITGLGFNPDFVWIKRRSSSYSNLLFDSVRGFGSTGWTRQLISDSTAAEDSGTTNTISSFNSDGFTLGTDGGVNFSGSTYVGWTWDAGSSTVTNTAGSITTTVSVRANATAGFSIVTYTANGSNTATVGHGLGIKPSLIIHKQRNNAESWRVYHISRGGNGQFLSLNGTAGFSSSSDIYPAEPTSTVFTPGNEASMNSGTYNCLAYCFAPVAGYSAMGSYVGNGSSDGPFVWTGHRSRWIMIKDATQGGLGQDWVIIDTSRDSYNVVQSKLYANLSNAESTNTNNAADILSNGFKLRSTNSATNASGDTYIWASFAENPFQYSRAR